MSSKIDINDPYYNRLHDYLKHSNAETDRGKALVIASLVEEMLEEIIKVFLDKGKSVHNLLRSSNAPLSPLYAKVNLCRALCLISQEEYEDIELIRKIRNEFAHNLRCSFEDEKIKHWAKSLKLGMQKLDKLERGHKSRVDDPKSRFSMISASIVTNLYNRAHYTKKLKVSDARSPFILQIIGDSKNKQE